MTIIAFILVLISCWMFYHYAKGDEKEYASWKKLMMAITNGVVRYYYVGTPTKVVMLSLRSVMILFEVAAIGYPLCSAVIHADITNGFFSIFWQCQWDSVSSRMVLWFLAAIVIIVVTYLITRNYETKTEKKILANTEKTSEGIDRVEHKIDMLLENQKWMRDGSQNDSPTIKELLPAYDEDIKALRIKSAYRHLQYFLNQLKQKPHPNPISIAAVQCTMGECARYMIDTASKPHYEEAYRLLKEQKELEKELYVQTIEGLIYVACKEKNAAVAQRYVEELRHVNSESIWNYVPKLVMADDLDEAYQSIPEGEQKFQALTNAVFIGCKAQDYQLGVDVETYTYQGLMDLTYENYPTWMFEMSLAATRFVRKFTTMRNTKSLWHKETQDLYQLTHTYLELLNKTEMDNLMPDTVFLENLTGYIKDQDERRFAIMEGEKGKAHFKELYYLGYAMMLMDVNKYPQALQLLKEYGDDAKSSIQNMRIVIALRIGSADELVEAVKDVVERKESLPNHLLPNYMQAFNLVYDDVKQYAGDIIIEDVRSKFLFDQFILLKEGKDVDVKRLQEEEQNFDTVLIPFLAMIYQSKLGLDRAIKLLKPIVVIQEPDLRTHLLVGFYSLDKKYTIDLYHLLRDLRKSGVLLDEFLRRELVMAEKVHDSKAVAKISSHLLAFYPDDSTFMFYHVRALRAIGDIQTLKTYESRIKKLGITDMEICKGIVSVYLSAHEYAFALDLLSERIHFTKNQALKDFFFQLSLNHTFANYVCSPKEVVEMGDWVKIQYENKEDAIEITPGSTYERLVGLKVGERKMLRLGQEMEVEVQEIHNRYFLLFKEIRDDIYQNKSPNIASVNIQDEKWKGDPLAAIQSIAGKPKDKTAEKKQIYAQYKHMEMPLCVFINANEPVASTFNTLFDPSFTIYSLSVQYHRLIGKTGEMIKGKRVVLDLSALILMYYLSKRYGIAHEQQFIIPVSLQYMLHAALTQEDIATQATINQAVCDAFDDAGFDKAQSRLWNILHELLEWVEANCEVQIVEELLNEEEMSPHPLLRVDMDGMYIANRGAILLTEDWVIHRLLNSQAEIMDVLSWLYLTENEHAKEVGVTLQGMGIVSVDVR